MKLDNIKQKIKNILNIKTDIKISPFNALWVFHMNQNQVPFAFLADDLCYEILLGILEQEKIKFLLNISGPLLKTMIYKKSNSIKIIKRLIKDGYCELISSSYSEDITYVTPQNLREKSISLHKKFIENFFGVKVRGFWSSERVWFPQLQELLIKNGFEYSFVENTILENSDFNSTMNSPFIINSKSGKLKIFPDIKEFKWALDNFINGYGNDFSELNSIIKLHSDKKVITFAEDSEMFRIWAMEKKTKEDMDSDAINLVKILRNLKSCGTKFVFPKDIEIDNTFDGEIPLGWANWMDVCCNNTDRFFYEKGFSNWKEFIDKSDKINKYKKLFNEINEEISFRRKILSEVEVKQEVQYAINNLLELSEYVLISHMFEFGCVGIGGDDFPQWKDSDNVKIILNTIDFLLESSRYGFFLFNNWIVFKNNKFIGYINIKTGSIIHLFDIKRGISYRDYSYHFYGDSKDKYTENIRLYRNNGLWEWLKDNDNVPENYNYFHFNNYIFKTELVDNFTPLEIKVDSYVIKNCSLHLKSYFYKGKLELFYKLTPDEIEVELNIEKSDNLKSAYVNVSAFPDPISFVKGYLGLEFNSKIIQNKNSKSCLGMKYDKVLDCVSTKDFFSAKSRLYLGGDELINFIIRLYSL